MAVAVTNRRALRKYREFIGALETVWTVLDDAQKLAAKATDGPRDGFRIATAGELRGVVQNAKDHVDALQARARKYEAELVSKEWRI